MLHLIEMTGAKYLSTTPHFCENAPFPNLYMVFMGNICIHISCSSFFLNPGIPNILRSDNPIIRYVADRPQGLNEGFLINIDVLQCMISWLIDARKILQELWIIMAVVKFVDFFRFNLLNKLNCTKSGLYLMAR